MHRGGSFSYGQTGSAFGPHAGYPVQYSAHPGQYSAPEAKRFRHEKWNGMPGHYFSHTSPYSYSRPNFRFHNQYQEAGQQDSGNFNQQSTRHSFGFSQQGMSHLAERMAFPTSQFHGLRHKFKPGYSQGSRPSKRGSRGGSQFTNVSNSDLKAGILEKLVASKGRGLHPSELAGMLSCEKKNVNFVLYSMLREGLVEKISDQPPKWVLKSQANVSATYNSHPSTCTKQKSCMPATRLLRDVSALSVVPLRVQAMNCEPTASSTSDSYDLIPSVAIRDTSIPASADVHMLACSSCRLDPPRAATSVENGRSSSAQDIDQVNRQDFANQTASSSSIYSSTPSVSFVNTSDISAEKTTGSCGSSLQTVVGEVQKPVGRGRGILFLNMARDRLAKTVGASSVPASRELESGYMQPKSERFLDDEQFDSGIMPDFTRQLLSVSDVGNPVGVDEANVGTQGVCETVTSWPKLKSEPTYHSHAGTAGCKVLSGQVSDQSLGTFKPPLPPKQLIRADPVYEAAMHREANYRSEDDISLRLDGNHRGSSFAQSRRMDFTANAESDSYHSLPDSLSALSFRASALPSSRSLDDLSKSCMPTRTIGNPFAAALGIEDTSTVGAFSSEQVPETAGGLSLTSESFAALNKNSVSALMEYAQSRHVNVEIKCIGSFGPPHRPVYVFTRCDVITQIFFYHCQHCLFYQYV